MASFGIHLGADYSCVARIGETGQPEIIKNVFGEHTTPSVVYFEDPTNVVVGREAKACAARHPDLVVSRAQRQMGRSVEILAHGRRHSPESISALILGELAQDAADASGEEVSDVVITVPAYFGVSAREATRKAGAIAGLNVLAIVDEPVAAALHYDAGGTRTLLVYHLGGDGFAAAVVRVSPEEIRVVSMDGEYGLGGADWDEMLVADLVERFQAGHPGSRAADDEEFRRELAAGAEDIRKQLGGVESCRFTARFAGDVSEIEVTRADFEDRTYHLLARTLTITERTFRAAMERGVPGFDEVVLAGDAVRMPGVASGLESLFGVPLRMHEPELAVAKGAARYALIESIDGATVEGVARLHNDPGKRITTVVPRAVGIKIIERVEVHDAASRARSKSSRVSFPIVHLLRAGTPLPARTEALRFLTAYPDQAEILVEIWEQASSIESDRPEDNEHIVDCVIGGLPPLPLGSPVEVTFEMETGGLLRARAVELVTGADLHVELQFQG
ncbi:Hsp70 family protein [Actinoplanes sp. CA-142083]|uniref:Hsp70 family protein n=1 Tax=Actinoplanes sp. CA-142083 TaxID=3239903 RepID=UPI003D94F4E9